MSDERQFTLQQIDQARRHPRNGEFLKAQIARLLSPSYVRRLVSMSSGPVWAR